VLPAIFVTAELVRSAVCPYTVRWIALAPPRIGLMVISGAGFLLFAATMVWPGQLFPFVWLSLFFAIDPVVELIGGRSINGSIRSGRWDTVLVLFIATLICGTLWEFWNFWSTPRWTYDIPYADWLRIFEMPALGYGGYLPFGLEIYALFAMIDRLLSLELGAHVRFDRETED
jgi:hypothetical protein